MQYMRTQVFEVKPCVNYYFMLHNLLENHHATNQRKRLVRKEITLILYGFEMQVECVCVCINEVHCNNGCKKCCWFNELLV